MSETTNLKPYLGSKIDYSCDSNGCGGTNGKITYIRETTGMEALALLTLMANLELIWYRRALSLDELGIKRFIREVIESPGFVASAGSGLRVEVAPEAAYFNKLNDWKSQIDLPVYLSETRGIPYKK